MLNHKFIGLGITILGATLSSMSLDAAPAQASNFTPGSNLNLTANFVVPQNQGKTTLNFNFTEVNGATNTSTGAFGIFEDSTGSFAPYSSNGLRKSQYKIKDIDFNKVSSSLPLINFLSVNEPSLPEWGFDLYSFNIIGDTTFGNLRTVSFEARGLFHSALNTAQGTSTFQGQIRINRNNGNFQFQAEVVPEPITLLGAGTALGFGAFFKRQKSRQSGKEQNNPN